MDETLVKRAKRAWFVSWLTVTAVVLLQCGPAVALVAALGYAGVSLFAVVGFFLFFLLGDVPVPQRILLILVFFLGIVIELGALVTVLGYLTGTADP